MSGVFSLNASGHVDPPTPVLEVTTNPWNGGQQEETGAISENLAAELRSRFSTQEFHTFLKSKSQLAPADDKVTTINLKYDESLIANSQQACALFGLSREEFFLGGFIQTIRRYLGHVPLSFCVPAGGTGTMLPITTAAIDLDTNLETFWKLVQSEREFFLHFNPEDFTRYCPDIDFSRAYAHMFAYTQTGTKLDNNTMEAQFSVAIAEDVNLNGPILVQLTFNNSSLDKSVANLFAQNFIQGCSSLATANDGTFPLSSLNFTCPLERQMLESFNRELPLSLQHVTSVTSMFAANAAINPGKIAVYEKEAEYTYQQLLETSGKIAAALLDKFGRDKLAAQPIILLLEKNFECIASVLGVWRAGGHFLPVDANMQERLLHLPAKEFTCLLTNLSSELLRPDASKWSVLQVQELIRFDTKEIVPKDIVPDSIAYVTMTSGSTGAPKKCVISHRGLNQFVRAARAEFDLDEETNALQWVPFSFDVFVSDLLKSLVCTNGSLIMVSSSERLEVGKVAELLVARGVNHIHMTPTFALFACQEAPEAMANLKTLCLGGETLSWKTAGILKKYLGPKTTLVNCYGLTEATIESTSFQLPQHFQEMSGGVPIGRPLPGINVKVVDPKTLDSVPIGATGMLAISGPTIGSGDVTTVLVGGEPWLLTGDMAAWLPSGDLEFRGRAADSTTVKIGGLRINCEEVEGMILRSCPEVEGAAVLAVEVQGHTYLAAAVLTTSPEMFSGSALQGKLRELVPYYMVPQFVQALGKFPVTMNGKLDQKALRNIVQEEHKRKFYPGKSENLESVQIQTPNKKMEEFLVNELSQVTGRAVSSITLSANLRDQGFTSIQLLQFGNALSKKQVAGFQGISDLFTYSSISLLAAKLQATDTTELVGNQSQTAPPLAKSPNSGEDKICIVGMSFRLPGNPSGSIPDLWSTLASGTCNVIPFPANRSEDVLTRMRQPFTAGATPASFFPSIDSFDNEFFGIAPTEADHMCPEQRLFLEVGTEALVDAGYELTALDGANIGVYATASDIEYGIIDESLEGVAVVGRQSSVLPSRISYTYNLRGGNYVVDTACSAALTALEQAVRDLKAGQCGAALVGGANVYLYPAKDGLMGTNLIHSASARCLPFDERADGTVSGEGVFAYVLKRRADALKDGDVIHATFESIVSNSVGRGNGVTAPSVDSQVSVIRQALDQAEITVDAVDLLETHGTGTILGDQIELCALSTVFASKATPLTIGGSKHNFGHLDMAAGFLSLLKGTAALTLNSSPNLGHIQRASKYLDKRLFKIGVEKLSIESGGKLVAGISAYGLSGTNCHAVISVERGQEKAGNSNADLAVATASFLVPLEATRVSLEEMCGIYSRYIQFHKNLSLQDICGTQATHLMNGIGSGKPQKMAEFQASSKSELIRLLNAIAEGITTVPQSKVHVLDVNGLAGFLPKEAWRKAPAQPKCIFKKNRHWLPPLEPKKQEVPSQLPSNLAAMTSILTQGNGALGHLGPKLESLMAGFFMQLMQAMLTPGSTVLPNSNPVALDFNAILRSEAQPAHAQQEPTPSVFTSTTIDRNTLTYEKTFKEIALIWEDCLGIQSIAASDLFRDLGGDSLLTVQMMKRVSARFGLKLRASDAFANPSLSALAALVFNQCLNFDPDTRPRFGGMPLKMILFPGQGSQKVGMGESLLKSPAALRLFQEAESLTGMRILSRLSDPTAFQSTEFVQVALLVSSLAKIAQLEEEQPEVLEGVRAVAGLSVGEFAALVYAGALEFKDALEIVRFRGKAMQKAVEMESTGMVSVFGPKQSDLENFLEKRFADIRVSTILGDNQFAVGGPLDSCHRLVDTLTSDSSELEVIDTRVLRVAGAFHTEWMREAGDETGRLIDGLKITYPRIGVVMNADGQIANNKDDIRFNLKRQTTCAVLWRESMLTAHAMGIRNFLEISPSAVLTPILQKRIRGITNSEISLMRI